MSADQKPTTRRLQLTRVFNAPRERVFSYWTRADKMQLWSGCDEATHCEVQMDFRVGGSFTQTMRMPGKGEFSVTGTYEEIVPPERIVYRVRLGPAVTRVVVEFVEERDGSTRVEFTQDGLPDEVVFKHVTRGTGESMDKLETVLSRAADLASADARRQ